MIASSIGADQLDAVFVEDAGFGQLDRQVQPGLPADVESNASGRSLRDDLFEIVEGQRLDIGAVRQSGSVMIVAGFELTSTTS